MLMFEDLEELQSIATKKAIDIVSGNYETMDDLIISLQFILAKTYNIPLYSEYFKNRTLPELLFEVALHKEVTTPSVTRASNLANKLDEKEVTDLFGDMEEADQKDENLLSEQELNKVYEEFMNTGKFKDEGE